MCGAVQLYPVVAFMQGQPVPRGNPAHIGDVADNIGRRVHGGAHLWRDQRLVPGAKADNAHPARHGRRPCPCTIAIEK